MIDLMPHRTKSQFSNSQLREAVAELKKHVQRCQKLAGNEGKYRQMKAIYEVAWSFDRSGELPTLASHCSRVLKRRQRADTIALVDLNGDRHEFIVEAFTQRHQVLVLMHAVAALSHAHYSPRRS